MEGMADDEGAVLMRVVRGKAVTAEVLLRQASDLRDRLYPLAYGRQALWLTHEEWERRVRIFERASQRLMRRRLAMGWRAPRHDR